MGLGAGSQHVPHAVEQVDSLVQVHDAGIGFARFHVDKHFVEPLFQPHSGVCEKFAYVCGRKAR